MRLLNTQYENNQILRQFVSEHEIANSKNILIQIFSGVISKEYLKIIVEELLELLPEAKIIGATTDGEICNDNVSIGEVVLSFSLFENTIVETYYSDIETCDGSLLAFDLLSKIQNIDDTKLVITFADGLCVNGELYIKAFKETKDDLVIAGGMAGDNALFKKTFVFTQEGNFEAKAVVALLKNPNLIVGTHFSFGWQSLGKELRVTKAVGNRVYEIDGEKTVDIYKKYLGDEIEKILPAVGIEFPLIIKREGRKIARAVLGKKSDGSLTFGGDILEGDRVYFGFGNVENILSYQKKLHQEIVKNPVEALFVYSCMARKRLMGNSITNEIDPLSSFGSVAGFFTYGEFYSNCTNHHTDLLNETMTILTLSEDDTKQNIRLPAVYFSDENLQTIQALSKLVAQTTKELTEEIAKNKQKDLQLIEQTRMAAVGEMIANIAHQWRQPLSAISSSATSLQLLYEIGLFNENELTRTVREITKNTEYLSTTIETFRNFLSNDKEQVLFDLNDALIESLKIVDSTMKTNFITVKFVQNSSDKMLIRGVRGEFTQAIVNILNNAKDILSKKNSSRWIKISLDRDEENYIIVIEDNGGGIAEEYITKVFDPYFTTKHQSQGTGLGLYMSYKIIKESLHGKVFVANSTNGAIFTIAIPVKNYDKKVA